MSISLPSVRWSSRWKAEKDGVVIEPGMEKPFGVPPDFADYFKLMTECSHGLQGGSHARRTVMIGREGSNRPYPEIGIPDSHHPITHHQRNRAAGQDHGRSTPIT